ncbi:MAG: phosphatidate cytidylyltransferase [Prevotellaceae bacterium]|nr:phosphatidate cytidylyltransferase [Prevotellaceae bacterium]MDO4931221.1 phosphatidate cytidylyltransferase [Prevotellaceae bacterium]
MRNFIVRAVTGILFVAVVICCFLTPLSLILLFAVVTGATIWEFTGLVNNREHVHTNRFISTAAGVFLFLAVAGYCSGMTPSSVFIPYLITIIYLLVSGLFTRAADPVHDWAYAMMSQMYIALPFSCITVLAFNDYPGNPYSMPLYNALLPLSVFIFLWMNDTGAYLTGSLLGRHKLFPRISPGKSWEGSVGGAVIVLAVAALVAWVDDSMLLADYGVIQTGLTTAEWMGLGAVVVVFGTLGDLVESLLKRTLAIKDSGRILPGHGGMLDRFDSSLIAIPASVVYMYTLTSIL